MNRPQNYKQFVSKGGSRIFRIPLEAFPKFWVNTYLVMTTDTLILIDTGSGSDISNQGILDGFNWVSSEINKEVTVSDLTHILLTHGHIDHMGGLVFLETRTNALVGIHDLDVQTVSHHEERMALICSRLESFLQEAGVQPGQREYLLDLYKLTKSFFHSVPIDFTFEDNGMKSGPISILHIPGHCPGQVAFCLDDFVFVGDHVLNGITPHQSPERIMPYLGVGHYLDSLKKLVDWVAGDHVVLSGHDVPIENLGTRSNAIRKSIHGRLNQCLDFLKQPKTLMELTDHLYPQISGYNELLVIEKTGAYVEYLHQRGYLHITNFDQVVGSKELPLTYQCTNKIKKPYQAKEEDYVLI